MKRLCPTTFTAKLWKTTPDELSYWFLDVLALLEKLVVQRLWTLQGVDWFDVVRVVPRFADPRIQSNFAEN